MRPTKAGYYWALWTVAEEGTFEGNELAPALHYEIVEVWQNDDENGLRVSIPGVRESQTLDCFFWGEFVCPLSRT